MLITVILQQCESVDYFLEDDAKILFQVFHQTLLTLLSLNDTSQSPKMCFSEMFSQINHQHVTEKLGVARLFFNGFV